MPEQAKSSFERFLLPVFASRFVTLSAIFHLILIAVFGRTVLSSRTVEPPDFQAGGDVTVSTGAADAPPPPPATSLPPAPPVVTPPIVSVASGNLAMLTSLNASSAAFSMPLPPIAPPTLGPGAAGLSAPAPGVTSNVPDSLSVGPAMAPNGPMGGRTSDRRSAAGDKYGEKPGTEPAIQRALQWLQAQQHADGTWGTPGLHDAMTGLALLCYLGHGETPQSSREFGVVVANAITALVSEGGANRGHLGGAKNFAPHSAVVQHAICTAALCEAYAMTKDDRLPPIITQAVDFILSGQRPDGGWAYGYDMGPDPPNGARSDTSVSGWQIMALKAADVTGLPGIDDKVRPAMDNAMKNLDRVFNETEGIFGTHTSADVHDRFLVGTGVASKLIGLGRPDHSVHEGFKNIVSHDLDYGGKDTDLYAWYFNTQACFQAQGAPWDWWKDRFQDQLVPRQSSDGSWPPTAGKESGNAFALSGIAADPANDGPVYRDTFCTLMLEVFYRYLPTASDNGESL